MNWDSVLQNLLARAKARWDRALGNIVQRVLLVGQGGEKRLDRRSFPS